MMKHPFRRPPLATDPSPISQPPVRRLPSTPEEFVREAEITPPPRVVGEGSPGLSQPETYPYAGVSADFTHSVLVHLPSTLYEQLRYLAGSTLDESMQSICLAAIRREVVSRLQKRSNGNISA